LTLFTSSDPSSPAAHYFTTNLPNLGFANVRPSLLILVFLFTVFTTAHPSDTAPALIKRECVSCAPYYEGKAEFKNCKKSVVSSSPRRSDGR
jgi:hypothetical protein